MFSFVLSEVKKLVFGKRLLKCMLKDIIICRLALYTKGPVWQGVEPLLANAESPQLSLGSVPKSTPLLSRTGRKSKNHIKMALKGHFFSTIGAFFLPRGYSHTDRGPYICEQTLGCDELHDTEAHLWFTTLSATFVGPDILTAPNTLL